MQATREFHTQLQAKEKRNKFFWKERSKIKLLAKTTIKAVFCEGGQKNTNQLHRTVPEI